MELNAAGEEAHIQDLEKAYWWCKNVGPNDIQRVTTNRLSLDAVHKNVIEKQPVKKRNSSHARNIPP